MPKNIDQQTQIAQCNQSCYFMVAYTNPKFLCTINPERGLRPPRCYSVAYPGDSCGRNLTQERLGLIEQSAIEDNYIEKVLVDLPGSKKTGVTEVDTARRSQIMAERRHATIMNNRRRFS